MSILIKGMEMPKSCVVCPCIYDGYCQALPYNEDDDYFREVNYKEFGNKRRDDCPLIELPPHGRLIDADELMTVTEMVNGEWKTYLEVFEIINAPTIIEAEEGDYACSSCRFNPPSSCDGKPCTVCDTSDPLMNCYQKAEGE